ncbi:MAG TPA: Na+/H+ antiporter subunit E [Segeticoccus sp.]|uniref:Na+/H+ antiporter subunit E n=1 Tax=Segeticoccus sp. TaxID=2706531 RepID=UPI002D7E4F52|nr:Na+/H+ antiporter subunit E [Segeticoccus sp.]HET8600206.1 Na+/H+ antiporter subunit E [Segeticoccus sp.]
MRPRRVQPFPLVWLTAIWLLLQGSVTWGNVLSGLLLSALVLVAFPLPRLIVGVRVRPLALVVLAARFLLDLVVASSRVAWQAIRPGPVVTGRVLQVQLVGRQDLFLTITAEMVALVPGTVVIDLDPGSGLLLLHALDVHTDDQVEETRRAVRGQEWRVLRALAPDPLPTPFDDDRSGASGADQEGGRP